MANINAAVALILDEDRTKVYITLRQKHQSYADYWEFPGGKVELGETFEKCIIREVYEEIGLKINSISPYFEKSHINKDNVRVNLKFFITNDFCGSAYQKENQQLKLVNISDLSNFKFLPASIEVIEKLKNDYI